MNEKNVNDTDSVTVSLGGEMKKMRLYLNMTQQQFADSLLTSRTTISKTEQTEIITPDLGYRIYYATAKIIGNPYIAEYIREQAKKLQYRIETEILLKEQKKNIVNPIGYIN